MSVYVKVFISPLRVMKV